MIEAIGHSQRFGQPNWALLANRPALPPAPANGLVQQNQIVQSLSASQPLPPKAALLREGETAAPIITIPATQQTDAVENPTPTTDWQPVRASKTADNLAPKTVQSFEFADFLDIINPLQHLPIIGDLYRAASGDKLNPVAQVVGGALFGGLLGAVGAVANATYAQEHGQSAAQHALASLSKPEPAPTETATTQLAASPLPAAMATDTTQQANAGTAMIKPSQENPTSQTPVAALASRETASPVALNAAADLALQRLASAPAANTLASAPTSGALPPIKPALDIDTLLKAQLAELEQGSSGDLASTLLGEFGGSPAMEGARAPAAKPASSSVSQLASPAANVNETAAALGLPTPNGMAENALAKYRARAVAVNNEMPTQTLNWVR